MPSATPNTDFWSHAIARMAQSEALRKTISQTATSQGCALRQPGDSKSCQLSAIGHQQEESSG